MRILRMSAVPMLLCLAVSVALGEGAPVTGDVVKASSGQPLVKAEVQLLRPGTNHVLYRTYTDARGRFAIRNVETGLWEVRVRFGQRVLDQVTKSGESSKPQKVRPGQERIRLYVKRRS